jgi:FixJ family two-component response regulator
MVKVDADSNAATVYAVDDDSMRRALNFLLTTVDYKTAAQNALHSAYDNAQRQLEKLERPHIRPEIAALSGP